MAIVGGGAATVVAFDFNRMLSTQNTVFPSFKEPLGSLPVHIFSQMPTMLVMLGPTAPRSMGDETWNQ